MENRYLYRGQRIDNGEWVEGFLMDENYINTPFNDNEVGGRFDDPVEIDESTLCQCTGLRDKNGKLIWENDIVGFWDTYSTESGLAEADCIGKVVWDDETLSFQVTNRLSAESYEVLDECSVIGNIFDNAELLEGAANDNR